MIDEVTGFVVPPRRPDIVADRLYALLSMPSLRFAMRDAAMRSVCQRIKRKTKRGAGAARARARARRTCGVGGQFILVSSHFVMLTHSPR